MRRKEAAQIPIYGPYPRPLMALSQRFRSCTGASVLGGKLGAYSPVRGASAGHRKRRRRGSKGRPGPGPIATEPRTHARLISRRGPNARGPPAAPHTAPARPPPLHALCAGHCAGPGAGPGGLQGAVCRQPFTDSEGKWHLHTAIGSSRSDGSSHMSTTADELL